MEEIIKQLKELKVRRIFVQFPEGLKPRIQEISKRLEEIGFQVVLCLEATYGACDIRDDEAKRLKCDAILHIGHSDYGVKTDFPVIYWDYFIEVNPIPAIEKEFEKLKNYKRIGLVSSIQFIPALKKVKEFLEGRGKKVFIAKSTTEKYEGQMLGCRIGAGKIVEKSVDAFLCISAGKFYGLGLALETDKPMFNLDLEESRIDKMDEIKNRIQKIIEWNKGKLRDARRIGLLVSWKKGQMFGDPFSVKRKLESDGKEVYLLAFDEITTQKIDGMKLDVLISFACPRIATDDLERFKIPIINFHQL